MKQLFIWIVVVLAWLPSIYSQNQFECMIPPGNPPPAGGANQKSYYGGVHTPKGHLHMLVVFVQYTDNYLSTI